jgi:hypothetical protein
VWAFLNVKNSMTSNHHEHERHDSRRRRRAQLMMHRACPRPLLTPRARAAHRRLSDCAEALVEVLRDCAPISVALRFVAECLEELAQEHREQAETCAEHEVADAECFRRWRALPCERDDLPVNDPRLRGGA